MKNINGKIIIYKVGPEDNKADIFCTTHQMDDLYKQFGDANIRESGVMNYIQHFNAALMPQEGDVVLDVCCGRSMMLPMLCNHGKQIKEYIGLDISPENIEEARLNEVSKFKCRWIEGNANNISAYIDGQVDFIIYTSAIEHMHPEDAIKSLEECYKVLKEDGIMILSTPNNEKGYDTLYRAHIYEWGFEQMRETLKDKGFEIAGEFGILGDLETAEDVIKEKYGQGAVEYCHAIRQYMPDMFSSSFFFIPFPEASKEILFILKK